MAVRTFSYRDLTPEQRRVGAQKQREKLLSFLGHPFVTADQVKAIHDKIARLDKWERLELEVPPLASAPVAQLAAVPEPIAALPPARTPEHHEVHLADDVPAAEKLS